MPPGLKSFVRRLLPRSMRAYRIWTGPLAGYRLVTSWHDYPAAIMGRTERPLLRWFAANVRPGETWLDVGAHYGYTAVALCTLVGAAGRVVAFEPVLSTAGYLAQTRALNRLSQLTVLPFGLAASRGLALVHLPAVRGMVDSTLVSEGSWRETILVASLDGLWQQLDAGARVHGVKIDVQGMELEVLRGMAELLLSHRPKLVVEVHKGVDRQSLLDLLASVGYQPRGVPIEPVEGEIEPLYVDDRSYEFLAAPNAAAP